VDGPPAERTLRARLRHAGLRTSKERMRRLMRENGLSAAIRTGRPRGPRSHDGTIIPGTIGTMRDEPCRAAASGARTVASGARTNGAPMATAPLATPSGNGE
jgi:hypothetical protein